MTSSASVLRLLPTLREHHKVRFAVLLLEQAFGEGTAPGRVSKITARIDVDSRDTSAEALWTRRKAELPGLRAVALTTGAPDFSDHGFDVVHGIVEAAARDAAAVCGVEVGPIEIAAVAVADFDSRIAELDGSLGPWSIPTRSGTQLDIAPYPAEQKGTLP